MNNTITKNSAGFPPFATGDGIYCYSSSPTILNSTIADNGYFGGGGVGILVGYYASATITNTIVWGNGIGLFYGSASITYCDVQGSWPGTGNISADPRFLDPTSDDYRLDCNSPCVDAGTNAVSLQPQDVEGDSRLVDGDSNDTTKVDIGADEFDMLWRFNGPAIVGGAPVNFTAQAPPAQNGNIAYVFISLGDGSSSGGIVVPNGGGRVLKLDLDGIFNLWLILPQVLRRVTLSSCPGASTTPFQVPVGTQVGLEVFYAGISWNGSGTVVSVTPTHSVVTQ